MSSRSLPKILVDQCLGVKSIPQLFADAGYVVTTIQEEYGSGKVVDERWLHDAGTRGWVVVTKDKRIRRRPAELQAFRKAKARVVCLTAGEVPMRENVEILRGNLQRLEAWWDRPGPWLLIVQKDRVEQADLGSDKE